MDGCPSQQHQAAPVTEMTGAYGEAGRPYDGSSGCTVGDQPGASFNYQGTFIIRQVDRIGRYPSGAADDPYTCVYPEGNT